MVARCCGTLPFIVSLFIIVSSFTGSIRIVEEEVDAAVGVVADSLLVQCPAVMIGQETRGWWVGWFGGEIGCRPISAAIFASPNQRHNKTRTFNLLKESYPEEDGCF